MRPLIVLSPGAFIDKKSALISISSFSKFYHKVSPKHQKRLKLIIIEELEYISVMEQYLQAESIKKAVSIINREEIENTVEAYNSANVFLLPSKSNKAKLITEALSFGMPVLSYIHPDTKNILDPSCSMLCKALDGNFAIDQFSDMLEMLYFDPEVRKILSKGARNKYNKSLNWGSRSKSFAD